MTASDVVVVGGGIGGAALAYGLARSGLGVVVLEASEEFPDRVRGESMQLWGLAEARRLGVEDALLRAGAHIAPVWRQYVEGIGEPGEIPAGMILPDISGTLNLRHPDACQALLDTAAGAGATVVRGVADVTLAAGTDPVVSYRANGDTATVNTALVVGADGRASTIRRQAGIELHRQEPINYIAGLLVDGLDGVPDDYDVVVGEGDFFSLMFHQGGGRARLYLCGGRSMRHRFAGQDAAANFMAAWNPTCYPDAELVARATPAGPCATYPGDDTWTDAPFAPGVVLIGDAAGHNDTTRGLWYAFTVGSMRVISIANDDVCYQDGGNSYVRGYSGGAQKTWLEKELAAARANSDIDWLVVCGHEHHYERSHPLRGWQANTTLTPVPVATATDVIDTTAGTVHMVIGGGGTSVPSNQLFFDPPACRVITAVGAPDPTTGKRPPIYVQEDAPWSAVRNAAHAYGFAAFEVDPGSRPGDFTTIKVTYYDVIGTDGQLAPFESFTLRRPRRDRT